MDGVLNGQVVAALSQWQGAVLLVVALAVGYGLHRVRNRRGARM